jgi:hypothetical protein
VPLKVLAHLPSFHLTSAARIRQQPLLGAFDLVRSSRAFQPRCAASATRLTHFLQTTSYPLALSLQYRLRSVRLASQRHAICPLPAALLLAAQLPSPVLQLQPVTTPPIYGSRAVRRTRWHAPEPSYSSLQPLIPTSDLAIASAFGIGEYYPRLPFPPSLSLSQFTTFAGHTRTRMVHPP